MDELTAAVAETECEKPQRFDIFHGREVGLSEVVLSQHDVVELQVRRSQLQVDVPGALFIRRELPASPKGLLLIRLYWLASLWCSQNGGAVNP